MDKTKCKKFRKTKDPKCNLQLGCAWVVKEGCLNIISPVNDPVKGPVKDHVKVLSHKRSSCKKFKKTKDPKCNEQLGCDWVVGKGCLNESSVKSLKVFTDLLWTPAFFNAPSKRVKNLLKDFFICLPAALAKALITAGVSSIPTLLKIISFMNIIINCLKN